MEGQVGEDLQLQAENPTGSGPGEEQKSSNSSPERGRHGSANALPVHEWSTALGPSPARENLTAAPLPRPTGSTDLLSRDSFETASFGETLRPRATRLPPPGPGDVITFNSSAQPNPAVGYSAPAAPPMYGGYGYPPERAFYSQSDDGYGHYSVHPPPPHDYGSDYTQFDPYMAPPPPAPLAPYVQYGTAPPFTAELYERQFVPPFTPATMHRDSTSSLAHPGSQYFTAEQLGSNLDVSLPRTPRTLREWLFDAVETRNATLLQMVLEYGLDVNNERGKNNECALILASKLAYNEILELLLQWSKINVNVTDHKGWTALHWAAVMNNAVGAEMLCIAGADPFIRTSGGKTALDLAVVRNNTNTQEVILSWNNRQNLDNKYPATAPDAQEGMVVAPEGATVYRAETYRHVRACIECGNSKTPQWRRGPDGSVCLCNACGLRYIKASRRRSRRETQPQSVPVAGLSMPTPQSIHGHSI